MVNLPKKIKIGGHIWKIEYPYIFQERLDRYAQCDDARKLITITDLDGNGNQRAESSVVVTFIHEILHAIDYLIGHKIFSDNEPAIEGISEAIYQVLIDNPELKEILDNANTRTAEGK